MPIYIHNTEFSQVVESNVSPTKEAVKRYIKRKAWLVSFTDAVNLEMKREVQFCSIEFAQVNPRKMELMKVLAVVEIPEDVEVEWKAGKASTQGDIP